MKIEILSGSPRETSLTKKFSPDGDLLDESFQGSVHNFVTEFPKLSEKIVTENVLV